MEDKIGVKGVITVAVKRFNGSSEHIGDYPNMVLSAGKDWMFGQVYSTGTTAQAKYIALTSDTASPLVGDTVLTSEITSGGLARSTATYSHVASSTQTTLTVTYTASTAFTGVRKAAIFTATTGGTMVHEGTFPSVNLSTSDVLSLVWTIGIQ